MCYIWETESYGKQHLMATETSPDTPFEKEPQFSSDETTNSEIKRPEHIASSGTLDKLVDAARGYAEKATAENTCLLYTSDAADE